MKPQKVATIATLVSLVGLGAAQAQSSNSLQFSGDIEAGYGISGSNGFGLGSADFTLTGPISGNLGFSIGLEAVLIDASFGSQPYFSLDYRMANGTLSFGAPRFALDKHLSRGRGLGGMKALNTSELGLIGGSASFARILLMQASDDVALGVRYDGTAGNLSYSASAHYAIDFSGGGGVGIYQLGMTWEQGPIAVFGGAEYIGTGAGVTGLNLGAEYTTGPLKLGARVSNISGFGGAAQTSYGGWAAYSVGQNLELTASVLGAGSTNMGGLSAKYSLSNGLYITGGVLASLSGSGNVISNIGAGFKF